MISEPLPNFKTQYSQKEEVGSYDNIALNQRCISIPLRKQVKQRSKMQQRGSSLDRLHIKEISRKIPHNCLSGAYSKYSIERRCSRAKS